jgi:hypothetical protein
MFGARTLYICMPVSICRPEAPKSPESPSAESPVEVYVEWGICARLSTPAQEHGGAQGACKQASPVL